MGKRVIVATVLGLIAGILCLLGAKYMAGTQCDAGMTLGIIFNRAVIGFLIGVSAWKLNWALHGIVMGAIGGSPMWLGAVSQGFGTLVLLSVFSIIWGFLIELFTSKVFKAPQGAAQPVKAAPAPPPQP